MRDTAYRAMQIKEQLTNKNNREPTVEEIAKIMEMPKEQVVLALEAIVEPVSLYEPVFSDGNDTIYVMDQIGNKNDDSTWLGEIAVKESNYKSFGQGKADSFNEVFSWQNSDGGCG